MLELADPVLAATQLFQAMLGALQMRMLMNPTAPPSHREVDRNIATAVAIFLDGARMPSAAARLDGGRRQ